MEMKKVLDPLSFSPPSPSTPSSSPSLLSMHCLQFHKRCEDQLTTALFDYTDTFICSQVSWLSKAQKWDRSASPGSHFISNYFFPGIFMKVILLSSSNREHTLMLRHYSSFKNAGSVGHAAIWSLASFFKTI